MGFTLYESKDKFYGLPVEEAIDPSAVYRGLTRALANLDEEQMMTRFKQHALYNKDAKALYARLINDASVSESDLTNTDTVVNGTNYSYNLLRSFVNAFKNENINWYITLTDTSSGKVNVIESNRASSKKLQVDQWSNNFITKAEELDKEEVRTELTKSLDSILRDLDYITVENGRIVQSSMKDLEKVANRVKTNFQNIGIELSEGYIVYTIINNQKTDAELIALGFNADVDAFHSSYSTLEGISKEDLKQIKAIITVGNNPFEKFNEKGEETGAVTRIEKLAETNALFDETVGDSNFRNADGKTVYSILKPTFALVKLRDLKDSNKRNTIASNVFIAPDGIQLNHLMQGNHVDKLFKNLNPSIMDGMRNTDLSDDKKTRISTEEEEAGTTFGSFSDKQYILNDIALFISNRKTIKGAGVLALYNLNQMEASNTSYLVSLPVEQYYKNGKLTNKATTNLLNYFKQEFARIQQVKINNNKLEELKKQLRAAKPEDKQAIQNSINNIPQYVGYNIDKEGNIADGRGNKFMEFGALSVAKKYAQIANDNAHLNINDLFALIDEEEVKASIAEYNQAAIDEYIKELVTRGIITKTVVTNTATKAETITYEGNNLFPTSIKGLGINEYISGNDVNVTEFISDYFMNSYINRLGINNLLIDDYSQSIKNTIDWYKRAKGMIGSGVDFGTGFHKVAVYEEPTRVVTSKELTNMSNEEQAEFKEALRVKILDGNPEMDKKEVDKLVKKSFADLTSRIDVSDAQSYVTLDHKILQLKRLGRFNNDVEAIYGKMLRNQPITFEEYETLGENNAALNSTKTVTYDGKHYLKLSEFVLTPNLVQTYNEETGIITPKKGFEFHFNMYNSMKNQGVDQVMPASASKMATKKLAKFAKDGNFDFSESIEVIENKYKRLQVETPTGKTKIIHGTQLIQLVHSEQQDDLAIDFKYNSDIKNLGQLRNHYRQLLADNRYDSFTEAQKAFQDKNGKADLRGITKKFYNNLQEGGADENMLNFFKPDASGNRQFDWNLGPIKSKAEQLFLAHFTKGVLSQKVAGLKVSLVSDEGIYKEDGTQLQFMVKDDDGNYYSECMLPPFVKEFIKTDEAGNIIYIDPKQAENVLKMFGIRIPTQDKHSMMSLKVVGWLPVEYGSVGIFPKQVVLLSGADFDIDSMFIQRPDFKVVEGDQFKVYNDQNSDDVDTRIKSRNNALLEAQIKFLTNDYVREGAALIPASMDSIKAAEILINVDLRNIETKTFTPNMPISLLMANRSNMEGKVSIGPVALINNAHAFLSSYEVQLNKPLLTINGKSINGYTGNLDSAGNRKNDNISTLLSAMTDNAKEQLAVKLNLIFDPTGERFNTLNIADQLLALGLTMEDAMLIVNQPVSMSIVKNQAELGAAYKTFEKGLTPDEKKAFNNLTFTTQELKDDIQNNADLFTPNQYRVYKLLQRAKSFNDYVTQVSTFLSLNKGLKATFADNASFNKAVATVKLEQFITGDLKYQDAINTLIRQGLIVKGAKGYEMGVNYPIYTEDEKLSNPFDPRLAIINDANTFQNVLLANNVINEEAKNYFISQTNTIKTLFTNLKLRDEKALNYLTQFFSNRGYEKVLADKGEIQAYAALFTKFGNISKADQTNIGKQLQKLQKNPKYRNNKLIKALRVDNSATNQKSKVVGIIFPTNIKRDSTYFSELVDAYRELYLTPETKPFAQNLYNYLYFKDGLQFRNNSPINTVGPWMFKDFSKALTQINGNLNASNPFDNFIKGDNLLNLLFETIQFDVNARDLIPKISGAVRDKKASKGGILVLKPEEGETEEKTRAQQLAAFGGSSATSFQYPYMFKTEYYTDYGVKVTTINKLKSYQVLNADLTLTEKTPQDYLKMLEDNSQPEGYVAIYEVIANAPTYGDAALNNSSLFGPKMLYDISQQVVVKQNLEKQEKITKFVEPSVTETVTSSEAKAFEKSADMDISDQGLVDMLNEDIEISPDAVDKAEAARNQEECGGGFDFTKFRK